VAQRLLIVPLVALLLCAGLLFVSGAFGVADYLNGEATRMAKLEMGGWRYRSRSTLLLSSVGELCAASALLITVGLSHKLRSSFLALASLTISIVAYFWFGL
jgi:hypothetical protein